MNCNYLISPAARIASPAGALAVLLFLSACTTGSISDDLRPSATIGNQNQQTFPQQAPDSSVALAPVDDPLGQNNPGFAPTPGVAFLPVLGPPQSAISRLSAAVKNSARGNGVTIIPNGQTGAQYQVKGYFSALDDGTGTRLIFIWDVLDQNGRNVHRISGEERTSSRNANPWSAIDSSMIGAIVERTMQNLRGWISTRT